MDKKPKTYNEIIRMKKCYMLTKYYTNITENMFDEIYEFLGKSPKSTVVANRNMLSLVDGRGKVVKTYPVTPSTTSFDGINVNERGISVIPHYTSHSSSSSSGSSSNNNNNNR